jgi:hypothetical protein
MVKFQSPAKETKLLFGSVRKLRSAWMVVYLDAFGRYSFHG